MATADWHSDVLMHQLRSGSAAYAPGRSVLVLTLYLVCTLLVFSFILFEVLDVDASDFPSPAKSSIRLAEPPHDLKRVVTSPALGSPTVPPRRVNCGGIESPVSLPPSPVRPHARVSRLTLPRAALPDPSPGV
jgi:hypothetical protein